MGVYRLFRAGLSVCRANIGIVSSFFLSIVATHLSISLIRTTKNKFVHLALRYTLALVAEVIGTSSLREALSAGLDIAIVADNDFYSQSQKVKFAMSDIL